jgi:hypothetical protein
MTGMKNKANQDDTLNNTTGLIPQLAQRSNSGPRPFLSLRMPKMMITAHLPLRCCVSFRLF